MKKIFYPACFLLLCIAACNSSDRQITAETSENDVDAARNFIQAALLGDYGKARTYMLSDTMNVERMNAIERVSLSPEEKKGLAGSSINIHDVKKVNDSTTVVIYSNSFKNNRDTLRVLRRDKEWKVDFNYLFTHDSDTLTFPPAKKDSLRK